MGAKHKDITDLIIRAFYTVYNTLGYGFPSTTLRYAYGYSGQGSGQAWRRSTKTQW